MRALVLSILALALLLIGCQAKPDGPQPLLLLAASSTGDAVTELAALYTQQHGVDVKVTPGGSNALANQIMAGTPGDLFLSAHEKWAQVVVDKGLSEATRPLLTNQLVIVVPKGNPAAITSPADLLSEKLERLALAGEKVPAGIYAEQALKHAGVLEALTASGRIVRGQDVRLTLGYVEAGEVQAGIVYASDVRASDKVEIACTFPAEAHERVVYPLVLLKSQQPAVAKAFYDWLASDEALAIFEKHGFARASK